MLTMVIYSLYTLGLIASALCIIAVMMQKPSEEQKIMTGLTCFIGLTWLGYWFQISAENIEQMIMCTKIIYMGICHTYYFMLMFMFRYSRITPPRYLFPALCGLDCMINATALTMDSHQYFFSRIEMSSYEDINNLVFSSAIFHNIYLAASLGYCILMIIIALMGIYREPERLVTLGGLTVAVLVPTVLNTVYAGGYTVVDYTPVGYLASEIIIFLLIYGTKIYDVKDTAREFIFDALEDPIVVVDKNYHLKGFNDKAKVIFPELAQSHQDMKIADASLSVNKIFYDKGFSDISHEERIYRPSIKKITETVEDGRELTKGYVLWLTDVTEELRNMELISNYQKDLERDVEKKTQQITKLQEQMIYSFANLVESRDNVTGEHIKRTSAYVAILADELRQKGHFADIINDTYMDYLKLAAPMHDIGKMTVPDSILKKPGMLEAEEYEIMKNHTVEGGRILDNTLKEIEGESYFDIAKEMAVYHHEKWNGTGYPYGVAEDKIPLSARIMAVADFFDALTSARPYKKAYSVAKAYSILEEESGISFDPVMVDCFIAARPKIEEIFAETSDGTVADDSVLSERDSIKLNNAQSEDKTEQNSEEKAEENAEDKSSEKTEAEFSSDKNNEEMKSEESTDKSSSDEKENKSEDNRDNSSSGKQVSGSAARKGRKKKNGRKNTNRSGGYAQE
ncbi:MAG: HD domain-containing protein [Oscillospiraceae bacterium]|nr:HD domain-containing protein [Oscillospiraceae bacterium]